MGWPGQPIKKIAKPKGQAFETVCVWRQIRGKTNLWMQVFKVPLDYVWKNNDTTILSIRRG
jgi:hypothetical protein